mmetsp:Transcript_30669/g.70204  ORF Transcript_30669/g.70204 Transcript_30669/m.70204 type:complete len:98 (+) Transcript_30669:731-1024(+)
MSLFSSQLENHEKEKKELSIAKSDLKEMEVGLERVEWEKEILVQKVEEMRKETDELSCKLNSRMYDARQKGIFLNLKMTEKRDLLEEVPDCIATPTG